MHRRVMGIDVGLVHLALAFGTIHGEDFSVTIDWVNLVDATVLEHGRVPRSECRLHHTGMAVDRVQHVIQERQPDFDAVEEIVIERQPPGGIRDVEQVFVTLFRDRCVVVCPRTMHVFLGSSGLTYPERKAVSMNRAQRYVPDIRTRFPKADDVADAVCLLLTRAAALAKTAAVVKARAAADAAVVTTFDRFRYRGTLGQRTGLLSRQGVTESSTPRTCTPPEDPP